MGWDIVALGTHHTLPIDNPIAIAKRLSPICDGPISVGYFNEWIYDVDNKHIYQPEGMYDWIEISHLDTGQIGAVTRLILVDYCAQEIYKVIKPIFEEIKFDNADDKEWFIDKAYTDRFDIYELENSINFLPNIRIFIENVDMSVKFDGRWSPFVQMLRHPYVGEVKTHLDKFRAYIFKQATLCGCETVYYFPDQGYGDLLNDKINLPSDEWLSYLRSNDCIREWTEDKSANLTYLNIVDYVKGDFILGENDYIDIIVDDFSDLKQ